MKKELCILVYVHGLDYKSYIPFYVYSVWKVYPDYDVYVYLDEEPSDSVIRDLDTLKNLGCNNFYLLVLDETYGLNQNALKSKDIKTALRWFNYPRILENYYAAYIGDIDIFICAEKDTIYNQHFKHCGYLGLPYSNIVRDAYTRTNIKKTLRRIWDHGIWTTLHGLNKVPLTVSRLSGLHFFLTDPCVDKLRDATEQVVDEINNIYMGKSDKHNLAFIDNDEVLLYQLYKAAGFSMPEKESVSSVELMTNENPLSISFRPHHGLHLGIWRSYIDGIFVNQANEDLVQSELYKAYYEYFKMNVLNDESVQFLIEGDNSFAKIMFNRMIEYYEGKRI